MILTVRARNWAVSSFQVGGGQGGGCGSAGAGGRPSDELA